MFDWVKNDSISAGSLECMALAATTGLCLAGILGAGFGFLWAAAALAQGYEYTAPLLMR